MRYLLLALLLAIVIAWLLRAGKPSARKDSGGGNSAQTNGEPMVRCTHCGIYFPASEAAGEPSGLVFCSDEHRRLHQSD